MVNDLRRKRRKKGSDDDEKKREATAVDRWGRHAMPPFFFSRQGGAISSSCLSLNEKRLLGWVETFLISPLERRQRETKTSKRGDEVFFCNWLGRKKKGIAFFFQLPCPIVARPSRRFQAFASHSSLFISEENLSSGRI